MPEQTATAASDQRSATSETAGAGTGNAQVPTDEEILGITEEAEALGRLVHRLARALRESERARGVSSFVFGDGRVRHLHIHVVPLYPGSPAEYRAAKVLEWPDAPRGGVDDIRAICNRLRARLS